MKLLRTISKKRTTSPKSKKESDKQAQARLEEAQEQARQQLLHNGRHKHSPQISPNSSPRKKDKQQAPSLDLNANLPSSNHRNPRSRTRQQPTKSPNRSSLKDDSEAGKARRRQRRKCVSVDFCDQLVEVKDIVPAKDLVNPKKLWWQNKDYQKIVELSCAIVDLSKVDKSTETRGLEDLIRTDHAATNKTRHDVLMAQRILRERQIRDDEALSGLYQTKTQKYLQEAALRATQDEQEVQKYLADTRRQMRRTWSV